MSHTEILQNIRSQTARELAEQIVRDLDLPSPLIGAKGPPNRSGPEEDYVLAVEQLQEQEDEPALDKLGNALASILMDEAQAVCLDGRIARPRLLFNLCALLETVTVRPAYRGFRELREFDKPLRDALADRDENLYSQLLLAHAGNQEGSGDDLRFWESLLESSEPDKVAGGVVGIREHSFEESIRHLPRIEQRHWDFPDWLGDFAEEITLVMDTYADRQWPDCAEPFYPQYGDSRIRELVEQYATQRYTPETGELNQVSSATVQAFFAADSAEALAELSGLSPLQTKQEAAALWHGPQALSFADRDHKVYQLVCHAATQWLRAGNDDSRRHWLQAFCYVLRPAAHAWVKRLDRMLEYAWLRLRELHLETAANAKDLADQAYSYCQSGLSSRSQERLTVAWSSHGKPAAAPHDLRVKFDSRVAFSAVPRGTG